MLDLRKLVHLVAVSDEGSFTRAAGRLHLSQQALSGSIRALEKEVGFPLVARSGGGVTVLPAGVSLIEDAHVLLGLARAAVRRAERLATDQTDPLRIAHTPGVTALEVTRLVHYFRALQPELSTEICQRYPDELTKQILSGDVDIGLCRAMYTGRGLTRTLLTSHLLNVAVAADHHLAARESVDLRALAEEHLIMWGRPGSSGYTDLLTQMCRDAGFEPLIRRNPIQGTPPVTAVIGTDDVAFVTDPPGPAADGLVHVLELTPAVRVPLHAMTARYIRSEQVDELLHMAARDSAASATEHDVDGDPDAPGALAADPA